MKYALIVAAAGLGLLGAGCAPSAPVVPQTEVPTEVSTPGTDEVPVAPPAEDENGVLETQTPLATGDVGFYVNPPEGWGVFSTVLYKRSFPSSPGVGEDWEYRGGFSGRTDVVYRAVDPDHVVGREGYVADVLGYEKREDGYYVRIGRAEVFTKVPEALIVEEVPLANGSALLLQGPETSDGPSPFPNSPGELVAYVNTPNGPLSGGIFWTNPLGARVTIEEMKALLATVLLK